MSLQKEIDRLTAPTKIVYAYEPELMMLFGYKWYDRCKLGFFRRIPVAVRYLFTGQ